MPAAVARTLWGALSFGHQVPSRGLGQSWPRTWRSGPRRKDRSSNILFFMHHCLFHCFQRVPDLSDLVVVMVQSEQCCYKLLGLRRPREDSKQCSPIPTSPCAVSTSSRPCWCRANPSFSEDRQARGFLQLLTCNPPPTTGFGLPRQHHALRDSKTNNIHSATYLAVDTPYLSACLLLISCLCL